MASFNQNSNGLWAEQDPQSNLDYSHDWSELTIGDPLATSTWTCSDPALTITNQLVTGSTASAWFSGGVANTWYRIVNTVVTTAGRRDQRVAMLFIREGMDQDSPLGSALFPNKFTAIAKMKRDRLMMAARGAMPSVDLSDEYIWDKLLSAESETAHELRVPLEPTAFFPDTPTPEQITALNGMPWAIDPGYDYEPAAFGGGDKWGMLKMRQKPIKSVSLVRFAYPGGSGSHYDLPLDWLRMDRKYGVVQFVPSSTAFIAPLNNFVMQAIGNGRHIPLAIQVTYVAGLENVTTAYPELIDLVMKKASLKILEDAYLPQSGSISADGLSQSVSNDMDKHHDMIDRILYGGKGSNGGLMTAIHGIRLGVV